MSKIKKADLLQLIKEQADMMVELSGMVKMNKLSIVKLENEREQPQLKQLDQSVFDGLDEKWRFAAVDSKGGAFLFSEKPTFSKSCVGFWFSAGAFGRRSVGYGYNTTDWQNSLIERKELTGSDLCRAMLERGDKYIVCTVDYGVVVITGSNKDGSFFSTDCAYASATPINNQGEPLTASEVGL